MWEGEGKPCVLPVCIRLPKQQGQVGPTPAKKVAAPSQKTADAQGILRHLVAAHRAIAFLDPPANGALASIIGAIQLLAVGSTPLAIARQTAPQVPAIQKHETQPIG